MTQPRIVIRHHHGRDWHATIAGPGTGAGWGTALAALAYEAHAVTDHGYWIDVDRVAGYRVLCGHLGVRVELHTGAPQVGAA
jgi:hypothetical protein